MQPSFCNLVLSVEGLTMEGSGRAKTKTKTTKCVWLRRDYYYYIWVKSTGRGGRTSLHCIERGLFSRSNCFIKGTTMCALTNHPTQQRLALDGERDFRLRYQIGVVSDSVLVSVYSISTPNFIRF